ncbi:MAG: stage II sporulation protein D [Clostridium sp.]
MNRKLKLNIEAIFRQYKGIVFTTIAIILFTIIAPIFILGSPLIKFNPFDLNSNNINSSSTINIKGNDMVKVYITNDKKVIEVSVEDYIIGVLGSEMPVSFDEEALKAQAIAARTFYYSRRISPCPKANGGEICDTVHCQVYMNKEERLSKWSASTANQNYKKLEEAVKSTEGLVLSYKGELVRSPQFFSTSSGKTEDAKDVFGSEVPYLKSIESPGEEISTKFEETKTFKKSELVNKINSSYEKSKLNIKDIQSQISIEERSEAGMVTKLKLGNEVIKGTEFRSMLGLNSANFTIEYKGEDVIITCKGYGHGVGMSQWGANVMGKNGKTYDEILTHYYTGIEIRKVEYKN